MRRLPNGMLYFEKGETIPFICPQCHMIVQFDANPMLFMIKCPACGYMGDREEFTPNVIRRDEPPCGQMPA